MTEPLSKKLSGPVEDLAPEQKRAPADGEVRSAIHKRASAITGRMPRTRPLRRDELSNLADALLSELGLDREFLGYAMVAVDNAFWRDQYAAIPFSQRMLLLPHCLRNAEVCKGVHNAEGLVCAGCGACDLYELQHEAEALGYETMIAEGTPSVVQALLSGRCEAVLGVSCLDSLEKAFQRVSEVGIPHAAVPLLLDGCVDTRVDSDEVRAWMRLRRDGRHKTTRAYYPLLRHAIRLCDDSVFPRLVGPFVGHRGLDRDESGELLGEVEGIALDWLRRGGKRFRPFLTLAAYAAKARVTEALRADADLDALIPDSVRRVALAFEALHKASLAHDDVEDNDLYRYGAETLHRRHGIPTAINSGDYLVGLGYRLVADGAGAAGAEALADLMGCLTEAHVNLSRGQGMELLWRDRGRKRLEPINVLTIYALKTAPAFCVSLYAGLRLAGSESFGEDLRAFCRHVGVAYQIKNDLKDWEEQNHDKVVVGQDALAARPTILHAFAEQEMSDKDRAECSAALAPGAPQSRALVRIRSIYRSTGAFEKSRRLLDMEKDKARSILQGIDDEGLLDLLLFVLDVML